MTEDELEQAGIAAAKAGRLEEAQGLLAQVVRRRPGSAEAWWWLSQCLVDPARREFCVQRTLSLDPQHAESRHWLVELSPAPEVAAATGLPAEASSSTKVAVERSATNSARPPNEIPAKEPPVELTTQKVQPPNAEPVIVMRAAAERPIKPLRWLSLVVVAALCLLCAGGLALIGRSALGLGVPALMGAPAAATAAGQNQTAIVQQPTHVTFPTLPPAWTATPSKLPPTPTATATVGPTLTPTPASLEARLVSVQSDIAAAKQSMLAGQPAQAVASWDNVLTIVPEFTDGYFGRAQAYLAETSGEHDLGSYLDYLHHALADLNQAIALDPTVGAYYLNRYYVLDDLGHTELYRVDQIVWYRQALSDIRQANLLGNSDTLAPRDPAFELFAIGDCQAGLDEINQLIAANPVPSAGLNTGLAEGYACLGQYPKALVAIDKARTIYPSFERDMTRAAILYNLGRLSEARTWLDQSITANPYYCGCRYYLRALIEYRQGQRTQAAADIDIGSGNTWDRGGLRSYVLGHLALDAGQKADGIALLEEAEASMPPEHGSLRARTLKELAALGAAPLALGVSVSPTPTLLPLPQQDPGTTPVVTTTPIVVQGMQ